MNSTVFSVKNRPADQRILDFDEISLGYTREEAVQEAKRCLQCPERPCIKGCPVNIDIPSFLNALSRGKIMEAYKIIKKYNNLPGICGRVCPQEDQCAKMCVLGIKEKPVNIGELEKYVADEAEKNLKVKKTRPDKNKKSVGVVGSGPAGLTIAGEMASKGYPVKIYEGLHKPGGVLRYGIPDFRLPEKVIDNEIERLKSTGVEFEMNCIVGKTVSMEELFELHDAVFLGTGAGVPRFLGIPGENLNGVYSANEYLARCNLMKSYNFPKYKTPIKIGKRIAVIGGGNVSMDAARMGIRLGAEKVFVVYRRSEKEMPAREKEIINAKEEGVDFVFLASPVEIIGDKDFNVKQIDYLKMKLGEVDESGRKKPIKISDERYSLHVDTVIIAIGTSPNTSHIKDYADIEIGKRGIIKVNKDTGQTKMNKVYAAGDVVTGNETVISAMGGAKRVARSIRKVF
ncbi:MAG: NADPH-dependent glutamate synthase [Elusimicrobiota bacterium]